MSDIKTRDQLKVMATALARIPAMRDIFRDVLFVFIDIHKQIESGKRRTVLHTAYRAKTRRRNRRRK